jgi:MoxR-like ATPase
MMTSEFEARLQQARGAVTRLREAVGRVIVGQAEVVDEVMWAMVGGGHVLLEGAPGLGKTLLVRTLAQCLDLRFSRIQFTPDLMPSDVVGTNVLVMDAAQRAAGSMFQVQKGPIFGQVVLADEINRATPKTQSALLEAMAEHAVTIAGQRHVLDEPFFVLATENPIEMEGTYPLPEAQLDRFLLKVLVPNPGEDELCEVLGRTTGRAQEAPPRVVDRDGVIALRETCRDVAVAEPVLRYAARLVRATDPAASEAPELVRRALRYGAGVRGAQSLVLAAKAVALCEGHANVSFDDVKRVAKPALRHRLIRSFEGEAEGTTTDSIVDALLGSVPARPASVEAERPRGARGCAGGSPSRRSSSRASRPVTCTRRVRPQRRRPCLRRRSPCRWRRSSAATQPTARAGRRSWRA